MNSLELKNKVDMAQKKLEKRLITIAKIKLKLSPADIETVEEAMKIKNYKERNALLNNYISSMNYDFERSDLIEQLHDNYLKLQEVETTYNNWLKKYETQLNKESLPKIKVLWDFLNDWSTKVVEWYTKNSEKYVKVLNEYKELQREFYEKNNYSQSNYITQNNAEFHFIKHLKEKYAYSLYGKQIYDAEDYAEHLGNVSALTISLTKVRFIRDENYDYSKLNNVAYAYGEYKLVSFDTEKLTKIIEREKLRKYEDLCNRISNVVGEITNVDMLSIGEKNGELNGLVEGTKGKCFVETISAGGYNVQCFHYRVLVKKVK